MKKIFRFGTCRTGYPFTDKYNCCKQFSRLHNPKVDTHHLTRDARGKILDKIDEILNKI